MDAYEELQQAGEMQRLGLKLITELTKQRLQQYPVLRLSDETSHLDEDDYVQDFLLAKAQPLTEMLLATAHDLNSMRNLLATSISRYLVSQVRKTALGALRRKVREALSAAAAFTRVPPDRWRLTNEPAAPPSSCAMATLIAAAARVPVQRVSASGGERRPPAATTLETLHICREVLTAAAGSVTEADLAAVMVARLPWAVDDVSDYELDEAFLASWRSASTEEAMFVNAEAELAEETAVQVVRQLSARERTALAVGRNDVAALVQALGVGKSQASEVRKAAERRLGELSADSTEPWATAGLCVRLCQAWWESSPDHLAAPASSLVPAVRPTPISYLPER